MIHAARRVLHGERTGGLTTAAERREWAEATPETRAFATVRMWDEQHGTRAPSELIARMGQDALAYGNELRVLAETRAREEQGTPPQFSLAEVAAATDERSGVP